MNCPRCGSENTKSGSLNIGQGENSCYGCHILWTEWQQSEIDRLKQELVDANNTADTQAQSIDNLMTELANLEDSFRTIATENNELERDLATERERLAEAEKVIDGIAAAVTFNIGYPYIQLHDAKSFITAYRAKYPKGGE